MKSAREIAAACLPPIDDCDMGAECSECMGDNEARARIAEAVKQAREDGARWLQQQLIDGVTVTHADGTTERGELVALNPALVRDVAP